ncbi:hypothetical protein SERLA73DRAFT_176013 [Serpula lacrymans var. lacrymans S7.3]|uniref:Uncharacterized protein n=1 Tax=Serpula lacrymans var. lacrymans (strain S7.3) TaxID=936435 RepID=F8PLY6_SERL3|nr:hypothetical protein SERLA73DRAFT_176013 [Serpula lacrymans var. lacrymans S7.3]
MLALIEYVKKEGKEAGGKGHQFKPASWTNLIPQLALTTKAGAPKNAASIGRKWKNLKTKFNHVWTLTTLSGVGFAPQNKNHINETNKAIWDALIEKNPKRTINTMRKMGGPSTRACRILCLVKAKVHMHSMLEGRLLVIWTSQKGKKGEKGEGMN